MAATMRSLMFLLLGSVDAFKGKSLKGSLQQLPAAEEVAAPQKNFYEDVDSALASLQDRVKGSQDFALNVLKTQKIAYEKVLQDDILKNEAARQVNGNLSEQIQRIREHNELIRADSVKLIGENKKQLDELNLILANITLAQEFAAMSIDKGEMNFSSSELSILNELSDHEASQQLAEEHDHRLSEIEQSGARAEVSVLRLPGSGDAQVLAQALMDSLEAIPKQQQESEEEMKKQFERQHENLQEDLANLMAKQEDLNSELKLVGRTRQRLTIALDHLQAVNAKLVKRKAGLTEFARRLGGKPLTDEGKQTLSLIVSGSAKSLI